MGERWVRWISFIVENICVEIMLHDYIIVSGRLHLVVIYHKQAS